MNDQDEIQRYLKGLVSAIKTEKRVWKERRNNFKVSEKPTGFHGGV